MGPPRTLLLNRGPQILATPLTYRSIQGHAAHAFWDHWKADERLRIIV